MNWYVTDVAERLREAGDTVAMVHSRGQRAEFHGTRYVFDHIDEMQAVEEEVRVRLDAIIDDFAPDIIQLHGVWNTCLDPWCAERAPTVRFIHNHRYYCSGFNMTWTRPRKMCDRPHGRACLMHHLTHGCGSLNPVANAMRFNRVTQSLENLHKLTRLQVATRMMRENLMRNGFDPRRIELLPLYASAPTESLPAITTRRRMVLHPGGLVPNKGVWLMARGIESLPPDVELVFGGAGPLQAELEDYVKHRALSERIRVMGELEPAQWSRLFAQAEVVVMPSMWNEPLGLAGMFAMAHAKPVIAFQSFGINEWLQNGVTGYTVDFGDRRSFLGRVSQALGEPAQLAAMGAAGRKVWEQKFRPAQHVERLREFYRRVIAGG